MTNLVYGFSAELWEWQGQGAWCFVSVPKKYYEEIREIAGVHKTGFGSVRVEATLGNTVWKTSIFPDSKTRTYLLPVKKAVRLAEKINIGDTRSLKVELIDLR